VDKKEDREQKNLTRSSFLLLLVFQEVGQEQGVNEGEPGARVLYDPGVCYPVVCDAIEDLNVAPDVAPWVSLPNKGENFACGVAYDCR